MLLKIIQPQYELKVVTLRTIQIFLLTTAGNETFMATQCINICRVWCSLASNTMSKSQVICCYKDTAVKRKKQGSKIVLSSAKCQM